MHTSVEGTTVILSYWKWEIYGYINISKQILSEQLGIQWCSVYCGKWPAIMSFKKYLSFMSDILSINQIICILYIICVLNQCTSQTSIVHVFYVILCIHHIRHQYTARLRFLSYWLRVFRESLFLGRGRSFQLHFSTCSSWLLLFFGSE